MERRLKVIMEFTVSRYRVKVQIINAKRDQVVGNKLVEIKISTCRKGYFELV
jgi:hypothetical protein